MSKILFNDGSVVGDYEKPFIIAEVNSSHGGNLDVAKQMVSAAKELGCSCVKFQSWSQQSLYSKTYYETNPVSKRIVEKFSLSENELLDIAHFSKKIGVLFASTPYSRNEVDWLVNECAVQFIKIASMDINNYEYIRYIAKKQIPIVLSTGMAELDEIREAVKVIENEGNDRIILLHCVSIYPAPHSTINLNNIIGLRKEFSKYPIGFSDHTLGTEIASAAIALGAGIIEKHFTLDKSKMGMDNNMALEPDEMGTLVRNCENVYESMGTYERFVSDIEYTQRLKMRRSIVAARDLQAGDILTLSDLDVKRPGNGLAPTHIVDLVGKRINKDIAEDSMIFESDLL